MPKLTEEQKEERRAERAKKLAELAYQRRKAREEEEHAHYIAQLTDKQADEDTFRLFEYLHRRIIHRATDDPDYFRYTRNIHVRQERLTHP